MRIHSTATQDGKYECGDGGMPADTTKNDKRVQDINPIPTLGLNYSPFKLGYMIATSIRSPDKNLLLKVLQWRKWGTNFKEEQLRSGVTEGTPQLPVLVRYP